MKPLNIFILIVSLITLGVVAFGIFYYDRNNYFFNLEELSKEQDPLFKYSFSEEHNSFGVNSDYVDIKEVKWLLPRISSNNATIINQSSQELRIAELEDHLFWEYSSFHEESSFKHRKALIKCLLLAGWSGGGFPMMVEISYRERGKNEEEIYKIYNLIYIKGIDIAIPYISKKTISDEEKNTGFAEIKKYLISVFEMEKKDDKSSLLTENGNCRIKYGTPGLLDLPK